MKYFYLGLLLAIVGCVGLVRVGNQSLIEGFWAIFLFAIGAYFIGYGVHGLPPSLAEESPEEEE